MSKQTLFVALALLLAAGALPQVAAAKSAGHTAGTMADDPNNVPSKGRAVTPVVNPPANTAKPCEQHSGKHHATNATANASEPADCVDPSAK